MQTILTLAAALLLAYGSTAAPNAVPASDDTGTVVHTAKPRRVKGSERLVTRDLGRIGAYEVLYVSDGIEAVVSAAVSTLVITADDNVIDRIVTRSDGKRLTLRIDARSITDCTVRAVIPASAALRTLETESMGTIRCEVPLGNGPVTVRSSEGSRIAADIRTGDDIRVHVSGCSRFEGALKGNNCKITVTEGSQTDTRIEASGICRVDVSASSRASGSLKAHHCALSLTEGSVADMPMTSTGESILTVSSSSRFTGTMQAACGRIGISDGSTAHARVRCRGAYRTEIKNAGRFAGSVEADQGSIVLSDGSVFDAPFTCAVHGEILLDTSSRFAGDASAGNSLHIKLTNGSVMHGNTDAAVILVHTAASSRYEGNISAEGQAELKSTDGSVIEGTFAGGHIYAVSTASSHIALTGSAPVPSAVIEVASGSRFSAPALPVRDCSVTATSSGHAEVRCTGELLATTSSGGTVFYNGDCRVTTNNPYVRKQD